MSLEDLYELSDQAVAVPEPQAFDAIIAEDRTNTDPVRVIVPEFDRTLAFGPAPWSPVPTGDGIYYPKKGDKAIVLRPSPESLWIVAWTPQADDPDVTYG
jgi:hypothetical protein